MILRYNPNNNIHFINFAEIFGTKNGPTHKEVQDIRDKEADEYVQGIADLNDFIENNLVARTARAATQAVRATAEIIQPKPDTMKSASKKRSRGNFK